MKYRLVQILAVAMILSQTVSTRTYYPAKLEHILDSSIDDYTALSDSKLAKSARSDEVKLVDALQDEVDDVITQFSTINLVQFSRKNINQVYDIIDRLFDLKERLINSKHYNKVTMFNDVDNEIGNIKTHLQTIKKNAKIFIKNKEAESRQIAKEIAKIDNIDNVSIPLISDTSNMLNDYLKNIKKKVDKKEALIQKNKALKNEIDDKRGLVCDVRCLLRHIIKNNDIRIKYDRPDKQSMCNIIGISIVVCAIVTLCITLLIAVHNKNQANTKVKLLN